MAKKIFAGGLERRGAFETVKLTVVGEGRWTRSLPGMVKEESECTTQKLESIEATRSLFRDKAKRLIWDPRAH
jgi:hypothetical protein